MPFVYKNKNKLSRPQDSSAAGRLVSNAQSRNTNRKTNHAPTRTDLSGEAALSSKEKSTKLNLNLDKLGEGVNGTLTDPSSILQEQQWLRKLKPEILKEEQAVELIVKNHFALVGATEGINPDILNERKKTLRGMLGCFDGLTCDPSDKELRPSDIGRIRSRLNDTLANKLFLYVLEPDVEKIVNHLLQVVVTARQKRDDMLVKHLMEIKGFSLDKEYAIVDIENLLFALPRCPDDMTVVFKETRSLGQIKKEITHIVHIDFTSSGNKTLRSEKQDKLKLFWQKQKDIQWPDSFEHDFLLADVTEFFEHVVPESVTIKDDVIATKWYKFCQLLSSMTADEKGPLFKFARDTLTPMFVSTVFLSDKDHHVADPKLDECLNKMTKTERNSLDLLLKNGRSSSIEISRDFPVVQELILNQIKNNFVKQDNKGKMLRNELMLGPIDYTTDVIKVREVMLTEMDRINADPFYRLGCYLLSAKEALKPNVYYLCYDDTPLLDSEEVGEYDGKRNLLSYEGTFMVPELVKKHLSVDEDRRYFCFMFENSDKDSEVVKHVALDIYCSPHYGSYFSRLCNSESTQDNDNQKKTLLPIDSLVLDVAFTQHTSNIAVLSKQSADTIAHNDFVSKFLAVESSLVKGQKILYDKNKLRNYGKTAFAMSTDHLQQAANNCGIALSRKKKQGHWNIIYNGKEDRSVLFVSHSHGLEQSTNFPIACVYAAGHDSSSCYKPQVLEKDGVKIGFLESRTWSREDLDWWVTIGIACLYRVMAHLEYNLSCNETDFIMLEETINSLMLFQQNRQQVSEMCDMTRYVYNGLSSFELDLYGPIEKLKNLSMYTASQVVYCYNLIKAQFGGALARKQFNYVDIAEPITNMCMAAFPNTWIARPESDFNINYYFDSRILNKEKGFGTKVSAEAKDFLGLLEEYMLYKNTVEEDKCKRWGCGPQTARLIELCVLRDSLEPLVKGVQNKITVFTEEIREEFDQFYKTCFDTRRFEWSFWGMLLMFVTNASNFELDNICNRTMKSGRNALAQSLYLPIGELLSGAGSTELFEPTYERQTKRKTTTAIQMVASYLFNRVLSEDTCLEHLTYWLKTYGNTAVLLGDVVAWYHESPVSHIGVVSRTLDKDQFAGMREFSAMNFYGASLCRLTDGFFKGVCLSLPQDMMLVEDKNESVESLMRKGGQAKGLKFSISADCSRFGPNQTMEKMIFFIALVCSNRDKKGSEAGNKLLTQQRILFDFLAHTCYMMQYKKVKPPYDLLAVMSEVGDLKDIIRKNPNSTLGKIAQISLSISSITKEGVKLLPSSITMPGGMYQGSLGCLSSSISTCAHMFLGNFLVKNKIATFCEARVTNDDSFLRIVLDPKLYHLQLFRGSGVAMDPEKRDVTRFGAATIKIKALLALSVRLCGQILNKKKTIISRGLGEMNSSWYEDSGGVIVPTEKMMFATLREIGAGFNPFTDALKPSDVGVGLLQKGVSYNLSTVVSCSLTVLFMNQQLRWKKFQSILNCWPVTALGVAPINLALAQVSKIAIVIESFRSVLFPVPLEERINEVEHNRGNLDRSVFEDLGFVEKICASLCKELLSETVSAELEHLLGIKVPLPGGWLGPSASFYRKKQALRIAKELHFREADFEDLMYFPDVESEGIGGLISLCVQQIFSKAFEQKSDSLTGNAVRGQKSTIQENFILRDGLVKILLDKEKASSAEIDAAVSVSFNVVGALQVCLDSIKKSNVNSKVLSKCYETAVKCAAYQKMQMNIEEGTASNANRWNARAASTNLGKKERPATSTRVIDKEKGLDSLSIKNCILQLDSEGILDLYFEQYGNSPEARSITKMKHTDTFKTAVKVVKDYQMFTMLLSSITKATSGKYIMFSKDQSMKSLEDLFFEYLTARRVTRISITVSKREQRNLSLGRVTTVGHFRFDNDLVLDTVKKTNSLYHLRTADLDGEEGVAVTLDFISEDDRRQFFEFDQRNCSAFAFRLKLNFRQLLFFEFRKRNTWVGLPNNSWKWLSNMFYDSKKSNRKIIFPWLVNRVRTDKNEFCWNHIVLVDEGTNRLKDLRHSEEGRATMLPVFSRFLNYWRNNRQYFDDRNIVEMVLPGGADTLTIIHDRMNADYMALNTKVGNGSLLTFSFEDRILRFPIGLLPACKNVQSFDESDISVDLVTCRKLIKDLSEGLCLDLGIIVEKFEDMLPKTRDDTDKVWLLCYRCASIVGSWGMELQPQLQFAMTGSVLDCVNKFALKYNEEEIYPCSFATLTKIHSYCENMYSTSLLHSAVSFLLMQGPDTLGLTSNSGDTHVVSSLLTAPKDYEPSKLDYDLMRELLDLGED